MIIVFLAFARDRQGRRILVRWLSAIGGKLGHEHQRPGSDRRQRNEQHNNGELWHKPELDANVTAAGAADNESATRVELDASQRVAELPDTILTRNNR